MILSKMTVHLNLYGRVVTSTPLTPKVLSVAPPPLKTLVFQHPVKLSFLSCYSPSLMEDSRNFIGRCLLRWVNFHIFDYDSNTFFYDALKHVPHHQSCQTW